MLREVQKHVHDALVLDISVPDGDGLEVPKYMQNLGPKLRVLILRINPERM